MCWYYDFMSVTFIYFVKNSFSFYFFDSLNFCSFKLRLGKCQKISSKSIKLMQIIYQLYDEKKICFISL